jgi:hypothetical protein
MNLLSDFGDYLVFTIDKLTKTSKPGKTLQKCKIEKHTNKRLCVVHTLKYYIKTNAKSATNLSVNSFRERFCNGQSVLRNVNTLLTSQVYVYFGLDGGLFGVINGKLVPYIHLRVKF